MTARTRPSTTPAGPFTAVVDADGAVLASGWTADVDALLPLVHPSLRPASVRQVADLGDVSTAITRYHDGDLDAVDDVPVRQRSGAFLEHAWDVLRTVPAGAPVSYTEYAAKAGRPAAVRAAASACARNAAALFVPCHRVLRNDGSLGGFRWGLPVKRWLLDHEAPTAPALHRSRTSSIGATMFDRSTVDFTGPVDGAARRAAAGSVGAHPAPCAAWTSVPAAAPARRGARRCRALLGAAERCGSARPPRTPRRAATVATVTLRADAAAVRAERTGLLQRLDRAGRSRTTRRASALRRAEAEAASATAALQAEREGAAGREQLLARRDEELAQAFRALSADALAANNEQFVALAEGRIKEAAAALAGDAAVRDKAIGALLDPMSAALQRVEGQLRDVEKERQSAYVGLREQVDAMRASSEQLQYETKSLVNALRAPQVRGRWGELQLERVVQLAGMVEHCDFSTQVTAAGDGRHDPARTWSCTSPAASRSSSTRRCRSRPTWRPSRAATPTRTPTASPHTPASCARTSTRSRPRRTGRRSSRRRSSWCCSCPATRSSRRRCRPIRRCWSTPSAATSSSRRPPR